jgi:succinylglutamic semialdehyde dehydrogenase
MISHMSHFIFNQWLAGNGPEFSSIDPATGETVWSGRAATASEIDLAVTASRTALPSWAALPLQSRIKCLEAFATELRNRESDLAESISRETGKPLWESKEEVATMIAKVPVSIQAYHERRKETAVETNGITAATRFKPHGVLAVFGPFNFPGHLPNGHIVPALLAGNALVFKPSEMAPLVARKTVEAWDAAGLPPGVLNLVQGGRETGVALSAHAALDGVLFTGSAAAGQALHRAFAGQPHKILALEMGGNNPLIVTEIGDLDAAVRITILSAFLTAGQRCTCARRLIVPAGAQGDQFVERLAELMGGIRVGPYSQEPPPFMGPVISDAAADKLLVAQEDLRYRSGQMIVPMASLGPRRAMLSPGLMDVTAVPDVEDVEHFGPFLQLIRVEDFDAALREANRTAFGLAAGLITDRRDLYDLFYREIRAGVVNWNRPTTGASGKLPFGGVGLSGNHWPSGYYAADYCSYPVASLEIPALVTPTIPPGIP